MIEVTHRSGVFRVTYKGKMQVVEMEQVEFIEADEWLCRWNTANHVIICGARLGTVCEQLADYGLIRCHKGFAVNLSHIKRICCRELVLKSGRIIPLGRVYKKELAAAYEKYLRASKSNIHNGK